MMKPFKIQNAKWVTTFCLGLFSTQNHAAQYVELSAEIDTFGYRLADTNSMARATPKTVHVVCIAGPDQWFIADDFQGQRKWLFNGTNVLRKTSPLSASHTSEKGNSKTSR